MMSQTIAKPKVKIVPDTGFYIAAALKNGFARSYLIGRGTKFLQYDLYGSEAILIELQNKLESDKFGFDRAIVVPMIQQIRKVVIIVHPKVKISESRDPDDNKILECAKEAEADIILSFDKDLFSIKEFDGIKIMHPTMMQYIFPTT
jgi:uncharacterized protein